jgi:hypothetical protein
LFDVLIEIDKQLHQRHKNVNGFRLFWPDMTMIAFPGFVVVSHNDFAVLTAIKPILQRMRTGFAWLWQLPDLALNDAAIRQNGFSVENQPSLPDGILYHHEKNARF